ncbi:MAG TPA: WbqC family protein [Planctomycetota bacterium]|nr:WbqC family protein [Planctomycetota bacterium]
MPDFPRPFLAVHQPNYAPWLGWFVKAAVADRFVLLDDAQFPKASWVNRARVMAPGGAEYLTVPVKHPGRVPIREVLISDSKWRVNHVRRVQAFYAKTPGLPFAEAVFAGDGLQGVKELSKANEVVLRRLLGTFAIGRDPVRASSLEVEGGDATDRHIALCRAVGAKTYLSGQGAQAYNDRVKFEAAGIALAYLSFDHPVYPQGAKEFVPGLSALDFLCRTGPQAPGLFAKAVASARLSPTPDAAPSG